MRDRVSQTGPMTTILLVEDDPLQTYLIMSLLRRQPAAVRRAYDAAEAFCLVEQPDFARRLRLVISGHQTQGIGGPAFVAELHARMPRVPIVVLGMAGESPDSYEDDHVFFLPRHLVAERIVFLTNALLAPTKSQVA